MCISVTTVPSVLSESIILIVTILGTCTTIVHVPRISIVLSVLSVSIVIDSLIILNISMVSIVLIIIILILISRGWVKSRLRSGLIVSIIPAARLC